MRFLQSTPDDFRAGIGVLQVRHASDSPVRGRVRGGRHRASFEWGVAFLGFENAKRKERRKKMKEEKKETTLRNAARSTRMNYTHTHKQTNTNSTTHTFIHRHTRTILTTPSVPRQIETALRHRRLRRLTRLYPIRTTNSSRRKPRRRRSSAPRTRVCRVPCRQIA